MDAKRIGEKLLRTGRQVKQGATFGFADELEDVLGAAIARALVPGSDYSELLMAARDKSSNQLAKDWEEDPYLSFGSQAIGTLPYGFTTGAAAATNSIRAGNLAQGLGQGAKVGAKYGALSGLGSSEDDAYSRAIGTALGGGAGMLLGAASAPLTRLGGRSDNVDYRKVTKRVTEEFDDKAAQEFARQLAGRPDLEEVAKRAATMQAASKNTGIPLTTAEMVAQSSTDPLLAQQRILGQQPITAGRMENLYLGRSGDIGQTGAIEQALLKQADILSGGGSYDDIAQRLIQKSGQASQDITNQLSAQARPLYEQAYMAQLPTDNPILSNPIVVNAIERVRGNPIYASSLPEGTANNSIQVLDLVKRQLDDMAESASRSGNRNEARLIGDARTQLLSAMDEAAPTYAQARSVYSGQPDQLAMRQQIGNLADIDPNRLDLVANQLFKGTQQNAEMAASALGEEGAKQAAAARILSAMDTSRGDPTNLANKIAPDARTGDMLRTYAGSNAQALDETLNVINQAKLGERFRYGSPTQPLQQADSALKDAATLAVDVKTGGLNAVLRKAALVLGKEQDPQFYADMADLMLTDKGVDLIQRIASGQQNAIMELQQVGLPSLLMQSLPEGLQSQPLTRGATQATLGATQTPEQRKSVMYQPQDEFADIRAILNEQPKNDGFDDIRKILKENK